jgi:predicted nuclease with TOPRIM domain
MGTEQLTYLDLAERLNISAEAARALTRRMHLPRQKANDGKTLVAVDFSEIRHKPLSRLPAIRRADLEALQARVDELEELVTRAEAMAGRHRADYERERERAERLAAELLRMVADLMAAKEKAARLEGELAALRSRPWWLRLGSYKLSNTQYTVADAR